MSTDRISSALLLEVEAKARDLLAARNDPQRREQILDELIEMARRAGIDIAEIEVAGQAATSKTRLALQAIENLQRILQQEADMELGLQDKVARDRFDFKKSYLSAHKGVLGFFRMALGIVQALPLGDEMKEKVNGWISGLDERYDELDQKLAEHEMEIDSTEARRGQVNGTLSGLQDAERLLEAVDAAETSVEDPSDIARPTDDFMREFRGPNAPIIVRGSALDQILTGFSSAAAADSDRGNMSQEEFRTFMSRDYDRVFGVLDDPNATITSTERAELEQTKTRVDAALVQSGWR